jgi:hypothetical protein
MIHLPDIESFVWWLAMYLPHANPSSSPIPTQLVAPVGCTLLTRVWLPYLDVAFIHSVADQLYRGHKLSERQYARVKKILTAQTAEIRSQGVQIFDVEQIPLKYGIRQVDRTKHANIIDGHIVLKFPFHEKIVDALRDAAVSSCGRIYWDVDSRVWKMELTEWNVVTAMCIADLYSFTVDPELRRMQEDINLVESQEYSITLEKGPDGYVVTNAADSLQAVIAPLRQDLMKLVDYSGLCSYSLSPTVVDEVVARYDDLPALALKTMVSLCISQRCSVSPSPVQNLGLIGQWATDVGRLPIVVYNPEKSSYTTVYEQLGAHFGWESIVLSKKDLNSTTKVLYTNKMLSGLPTKLLVSLVSVVHGPTKRAWVNQFEKVVYYSFIPGQ